jgi:FAD:protein FMN transferase
MMSRSGNRLRARHAAAVGLKRMRPLLGTFVEIRASGEQLRLGKGVAAAFAAIERVQRLMSFHDPQSDVSRINAAQAGAIVQVDALTHTVLRAARVLSERSRGLFDATTADALVRHGFLPRPGADDTQRVTFRDLELLPRSRVRWRRKGWVDLGGIAKGFAVDRAIAALQSHGVASAVVNAGGDLRCFGAPEPIHVRSPEDPSVLVRLGVLVDGAIATSADYFSERESSGQRTGALVDPRRAACVTWGCSVSVIASTCMLADALTKVVALAPECAPARLEPLDAQALILDREGLRICGRSRASRFGDQRIAA